MVELPGDPDTRTPDGGPDNDIDADDVGYRKPPRKSRFQPGKSGNPRGRPKGAKGLKAELMAELDERVTVTSNGKPQRMNKLRVVIKSLAAQAAKGNVSAADKLLSLVIQAQGFEDQRPATKPLSDTDMLILEQVLGGAPNPGSDGESGGADGRVTFDA